MLGRCAICDRDEVLTRHHLIPRARHRNKRNQRDFPRKLARSVVGLCRSCHGQVHQLFGEKQLERELNTVEKLRAHPAVMAFAEWIRTKPPGFRTAMREARSRRTYRR